MLILGVAVVLGVTSCRTNLNLILGPSPNLEREYSSSKEEVFDAALAVGHKLNLEVKVLERESGLIRFERASLLPAELDLYCAYPLQYSGHRRGFEEFETFSEFNSYQRVFGDVSLTILIRSEAANRSVLDLSGRWTATFGQRTSYVLWSKGILEREYLDGVKDRLARREPTN
jgi:hypothetical protein